MNRFNFAAIFILFVISSNSVIAAELELTDVIREARENAVLMKTAENNDIKQDDTKIAAPAVVPETEKKTLNAAASDMSETEKLKTPACSCETTEKQNNFPISPKNQSQK